MFKKFILYTVIYVLISYIMSYDEIVCALNGENLCWYNLLGKYIIFMLLVLAYNQFIRPKIFKR